MLYRKFSDYMKEIYGEKVYKIPINIDVTCPNRVNGFGCTYCSEGAINSEMLSNKMDVKTQLDKNIDYISPRYAAKKFIAYFQNNTNTFLKLEDFSNYINMVERDDVVGISISTRPDSVSYEYLDILEEFSKEKNKDVNIELGLQTVNYKTLKKINRGHTLAEFIDTVLMIKKYNFTITSHMILNLPYDDLDDVIESAKILSALDINTVKMHSLYIAKNTKMGEDYLNGKIDVGSLESYIEKAVIFLAFLKNDIAIERVASRAPKEETYFCNYDTSWWKIRDMIEEKMIEENITQGCKYDYLGGKEVRRFL